jgi:uncharacterized OB-fold protein
VIQSDQQAKGDVQGFRITRCGQCRKPYFPERLICHVCGNDTWVAERLHDATVEQFTTVSHVIGGSSGPSHLATVRSVEGLLLVAGLDEPLREGTHVNLFDRSGAPLARAAGTSLGEGMSK